MKRLPGNFQGNISVENLTLPLTNQPSPYFTHNIEGTLPGTAMLYRDRSDLSDEIRKTLTLSRIIATNVNFSIPLPNLDMRDCTIYRFQVRPCPLPGTSLLKPTLRDYAQRYRGVAFFKPPPHSIEPNPEQ